MRKDTDKIKEERLAMNIVYQIGDAIDEEIKKGSDIVTARQNTNDGCIDFVSTLIQESNEEAVGGFATWLGRKQDKESNFFDGACLLEYLDYVKEYLKKGSK